MRPVTATVVGIANSNPIPLDIYIAPFQVSVGVVVVSGVVNFKLQYTYDDVQDPAVVLAGINWIDHALMTGKVGAFDVVINAGPVMAVRLVNAGAGTIKGRVVQAGR